MFDPQVSKIGICFRDSVLNRSAAQSPAVSVSSSVDVRQVFRGYLTVP